MALNTIQKALVESGLAKEPKQRKRRKKEYKCRVCGSPMIILDDTNIMVCSQTNANSKKGCQNFYLFDAS